MHGAVTGYPAFNIWYLYVNRLVKLWSYIYFQIFCHIYTVRLMINAENQIETCLKEFILSANRMDRKNPWKLEVRSIICKPYSGSILDNWSINKKIKNVHVCFLISKYNVHKINFLVLKISTLWCQSLGDFLLYLRSGCYSTIFKLFSLYIYEHVVFLDKFCTSSSKNLGML